MKFKSQIPNLFTLSNLICGTLAVYAAISGSVSVAAYFILAGAFFDVLDGMIARVLKVSGDFGKQLDSLADMVSFGVAPAFIALAMIGSLSIPLAFNWDTVIAFLPLTMVAFSAYRLAKFNLDTRQSQSFIGLPTPANALFWLSWPLILDTGLEDGFLDGIYSGFLNTPEAMIAASLILSLLLISELHLLSLKFSNLNFKENVFRYLLVLSAIVLVAVFWVKAIPIILILYVLLSIIQTIATRKNGI